VRATGLEVPQEVVLAACDVARSMLPVRHEAHGSCQNQAEFWFVPERTGIDPTSCHKEDSNLIHLGDVDRTIRGLGDPLHGVSRSRLIRKEGRK
jgi:hypothetical protein